MSEARAGTTGGEPEEAARGGLGSALTAAIAARVRDRRMKAGERLVELALAEELGVSRAPVRRALQELAAGGIAEADHGRGFFLVLDWDHPAVAALGEEVADDEEAYTRVAADRLAGRLPDAVSEARIVREYGITRATARRLLERMAVEGWVERRPGYGWRFLPTFPSRDAYIKGFRFRIVVEPAALLEPTFALAPEAMARLADTQRGVMAANIEALPLARVFDAGSDFHETLAAASGNPLMADAVRRVNRMRRLIEYRALVAPAVREQSAEHLAILDRVAAGRRADAADLLRRHLERAMESKLDTLAASGNLMHLPTCF